MAYKTAFEKNIPKLVNALPMNSLIPYLYPYGLMRDTQLSQGVNAAATDTEKTQKFINWMQPGVTMGVTDQFDKFIKAMDDYVKATQDATVMFLLQSIRQDLSAHSPPDPTPQPTPQPGLCCILI